MSMFSEDQRDTLRTIARESVEHGLKCGRALPVVESDLPDWLREPRATFVTLEKDGELRGCIGSLEARRPLAEDVADNAYAAAFRDPRFAPVHADEWPTLDLHIAVLSPPEAMSVTSEEDLLHQLRPGIDGLILEEGRARATFLPSVWAHTPDPRDFLRHLKRKAGLPPHYWSDSIRAYRYTTQSFPD